MAAAAAAVRRRTTSGDAASSSGALACACATASVVLDATADEVATEVAASDGAAGLGLLRFGKPKELPQVASEALRVVVRCRHAP